MAKCQEMNTEISWKRDGEVRGYDLQGDLSKNKSWTKYGNSVLKGDGWSRWEELKDLYKSNLSHPAPRVIRVVLSVIFG